MTREEYLRQQKESTAADPFLTQGSKVNYHSIKEGPNKYRFFPAHPESENKNFLVEKKVSWMKVEQDERDSNGKPTGKKALGRKPIFDASVHGGLSNDPTEMYIDFAKNTAIPNLAGSDTAKVDAIMKEFKNGMKEGIWPQRTSVGYADEYTGNGKKFGVLELKYSISSTMKEEAKKMLSGEGPVVNIWTDLEEAFCAIITKDSVAGKADPKKYYSVEPESQMVGKYNKQFVPTPLDDDSFNTFIAAGPLENLYKNKYTMTDFMYQLEGLQRFDAYLASVGFPINVFEYDEFLTKINALRVELEGKIAAGVLKQSNNPNANNDSTPATTTQAPAQAATPVATQPAKVYTEEPAVPKVAQTAPVTPPAMTQEEIDRAEFEAFKAAQRAAQAQAAPPVQAPVEEAVPVTVPEVQIAQATQPVAQPAAEAAPEKELTVKERFALLQSKIAGQ